MTPPKLTPKQEQFCNEYLIDLNATQAALRAGYSSKTAGSQGERLLRNVDVATRIQELQSQRSERTQITADRVLEELALIAFSNLDDFAEWGMNHASGENFLVLRSSDELTRGQKAVIKSIKRVRKTGKTEEDTLEIVREDKLSALDKLAKHLGLYKEGDPGAGKKSGLDLLVEMMAQRRSERER